MRFIKIFIAALSVFSLMFISVPAVNAAPAKATFSQGKSGAPQVKHHRHLRHRHRRVHRHKK